MIFEQIFQRFLMDLELSVALIFSLSSRRRAHFYNLGFSFLHYFSGKIFNAFGIDFSRFLAPKSLPKRSRKHVEKSYGFRNDFLWILEPTWPPQIDKYRFQSKKKM